MKFCCSTQLLDVVVWTELIWLWTETRGGLVYTVMNLPVPYNVNNLE
jgi:hypothetical protein